MLLELRGGCSPAALTWDVKDAGDAAASSSWPTSWPPSSRRRRAVGGGAEDPRRFTSDRVWIVDPLDGTSEFSEPGRHDWAVHVALWTDGAFGGRAVSLPAVGLTFGTDPAPVVPPIDRETGRGSSPRARAPRTPRCSSPRRSAAMRCGSGRPAPRRWRSCSARPTSTSTTAACTSGTRPRRPRSRSPRGCTPAASTARRSSTTSVIRGCPTSSCAGPSWPTRVHTRALGLVDAWTRRGELTAIRFEIDDRVATVWLHRPHRHNAWTGRMHSEYRAVMADLDADDVRAVVVTGTPPAFCVGGDSRGARRTRRPRRLRRRAPRGTGAARLGGDRARRRLRLAARVSPADHRRGRTAPAPGSALALVAFCDLRFVAADAKITTAAPKLGLPAEYGLSWMLPRLVGVTRAADLLLSGRVVTGAETADWGLWNGCRADGESTLDAALTYATSLATTTGPACGRDDEASDLHRSAPP